MTTSSQSSNKHMVSKGRGRGKNPIGQSFTKVATNTLIIVESPAKCATIMKYLGPGYRCIASCGHMRYLDGLSAIDVNKNYDLHFSIMDSKKEQIAKISLEIKMAARIVLATDDDREGEAIAWHLCDIFKLPIETTDRIVFHEITKSALDAAILNPKRINMNIVYSSHARQILDLLIGYKISPCLWKHISSSGCSGLSAGRCQTPALRLVYDNEREIENRLNGNTNTDCIKYEVYGFFTKFNLLFSLDKTFESINKNDLEIFLSESIQHNHVFSCNKPTRSHSSPPAPFSTSRLQQTASNELSVSPSETMKICQKLYESGVITYIRTTGQTYSADFLQQTNQYIQEKWGEKYINDNDKIQLQSQSQQSQQSQAHEAIRPTDITRVSLSSNDFHPIEQRLYKLIWKNALESCMADYTFFSMTASITSPFKCDTRICAYTYTCQKPIFMGWKIVQGFTPEQQHHHAMQDYLQNIRENSIISYNKIETKAFVTSFGVRYTEARLIQLLEEKEIGRPSTYSTIIDKISEREYVKKQNISGEKKECREYNLVDKVISQTIISREFGNEKNKLKITLAGKIVLEFLLLHFSNLFSYDYTKHMELRLDELAAQDGDGADAKIKLKIMCDECLREIEECIKSIKKIKKDESQYRIDDHHIFMIGKHGPVVMYSEKPFPQDITLTGHAVDSNNNQIINSINDETIIFKKVICGITIDDLKSGKYKTLSEVLVEETFLERVVGIYGGNNVVLKNGRFGKYVVWGKNGENRKSLGKTSLNSKELFDISLHEIIRFIEEGSEVDPFAAGTTTVIIRNITDDISIRTGKYGDYIFYKTVNMKKPKFISLKNFTLDYKNCCSNDILLWVNINNK